MHNDPLGRFRMVCRVVALSALAAFFTAPVQAAVSQVNILGFGAKNDGSADCTAAFNAAKSAIGRKGTVYFPVGKYRGNFKINHGEQVIIRGDGASTDVAAGATVFYAHDPNDWALKVGDNAGFTRGASIYDVAFEGQYSNGTVATKGIYFAGGAIDASLYNCTVTRFSGSGYLVQGGPNYPTSVIRCIGCSFYEHSTLNNGSFIKVVETDQTTSAFTTVVEFHGCYGSASISNQGYLIEADSADIKFFGGHWDLGIPGTHGIKLSNTYTSSFHPPHLLTVGSPFDSGGGTNIIFTTYNNSHREADFIERYGFISGVFKCADGSVQTLYGVHSAGYQDQLSWPYTVGDMSFMDPSATNAFDTYDSQNQVRVRRTGNTFYLINTNGDVSMNPGPTNYARVVSGKFRSDVDADLFGTTSTFGPFDMTGQFAHGEMNFIYDAVHTKTDASFAPASWSPGWYPTNNTSANYYSFYSTPTVGTTNNKAAFHGDYIAPIFTGGQITNAVVREASATLNSGVYLHQLTLDLVTPPTTNSGSIDTLIGRYTPLLSGFATNVYGDYNPNTHNFFAGLSVNDTSDHGPGLYVNGPIAGTSIAGGSPVVLQTTTPVSISVAQSGQTFNNNGALSEVMATLPTAATNLAYRFVVRNAVGWKIQAQGGATIRAFGYISATNGYLESITLGDVVDVLAISDHEWFAVIHGTGWNIDGSLVPLLYSLNTLDVNFLRLSSITANTTLGVNSTNTVYSIPGLSVTNRVLVAGGTTNLCVYQSGVLISNIANYNGP